MGNPAHTPGPWIEFADQGITVAILPAGRQGTVCDFASTVEPANARLIVSAPDLLEALRGVVRVADRKTDEFDAAHAAIAKATGAA